MAEESLVLKGSADGTTGSYLFDLQGNTAEIITGSGVKVNAAYNAWGQCNFMNPVPFPNDPFMQHAYNARWGYLGDETGLYYCQNRYYDPGTGRFLTRDPISFSGGMNLYGYCGGGPVGAVDPSGLYYSSATTPQGAAIMADIGADIGWGNVAKAGLGLAGVGAAATTGDGDVASVPGSVSVPTEMDRCDPIAKENTQRFIPIYRVYSSTQQSDGNYWSFEDPRFTPNYAWDYGLPDWNYGYFMRMGLWNGLGGIVRPAMESPGHPGSGGKPEVWFPAGPQGFVIPGPIVYLDPPIHIPRRSPYLP